MTERTTIRSVTFSHPFVLAGVEGEQRAGTYEIETIEDQIDTMSFVVYRRLSTTIVLPSQRDGGASRQAITIDPADLEAAQKKDAEAR